MRMKKAVLTVTVMTLLICMLGVQAFASEGASAEVYVTITNGTIALAQEAVTVTDADGDGELTINDALYAAHKAKYSGGASAGYATATSDYGPGITKLWGVENGGSYGYYVNNEMAEGLADTVKTGDYINAYVYTDMTAFSDTYCYFNANKLDAAKGDTVSLTLSSIGFDESWNPVVLPVEGAVITVDGVQTEFKTDAQGKASITLDKAGEIVISAKSDTRTLVPPVCIASVEVPEQSGLGTVWYIVIAAAVVVIAAAIIVTVKKKNNGK